MFKDTFLCDFIYFVIFPDADYNNQHMITASDKLVYDTQTSSTEFYFKKAGYILPEKGEHIQEYCFS